MVQPKPKQLTRSDKERIVEETTKMIESHSIVGILDMQSLPARQLQEIKGELSEFASVRMVRKTLMEIAVDQADKDGIDEVLDNSALQPALIFSEKSPFQLYRLIDENKTSAAAQGGEVAPDQIMIPEGDTGIGPGPMLGKLQQFGAQVQVQDGSIHVQEEAVMLEEGDTIDGDAVEVLNQLGIEPLEIGLDLKVAYSGGNIFDKQELDIDEEEYRQDVEAGAGAAFRLAVNAGVVNETTAPAIVSEAASKARNLSADRGLPSEETIEDSISLAKSRAEAVDSETDRDDTEQ